MYPQSLHLCPFYAKNYIVLIAHAARYGRYENITTLLLTAAWAFRHEGGQDIDNVALFYWKQLTVQKRFVGSLTKGMLKNEN